MTKIKLIYAINPENQPDGYYIQEMTFPSPPDGFSESFLEECAAGTNQRFFEALIHRNCGHWPVKTNDHDRDTVTIMVEPTAH